MSERRVLTNPENYLPGDGEAPAEPKGGFQRILPPSAQPGASSSQNINLPK
jgi:hypothetical protein